MLRSRAGNRIIRPSAEYMARILVRAGDDER